MPVHEVDSSRLADEVKRITRGGEKVVEIIERGTDKPSIVVTEKTTETRPA